MSDVENYIALIRGLLEDCQHRARRPTIVLLNPVVSEKLLEDARRKTVRKIETGLAALPTYTLQGVTVYVTARVRDVYVVDDRGGADLMAETVQNKRPGGGS